MYLRSRPLSRRIPEDVRERTRRAGVQEIDWYAGRLDGDAQDKGAQFIDTPPEERARLAALAKNFDTSADAERERADGVLARLMSFLRGARARHDVRA